MKKLTIRASLTIAFASVLLITVVLGLSSIITSDSLANNTISFYEKAHTVQFNTMKIKALTRAIAGEMQSWIIVDIETDEAQAEATVNSYLDDLTKCIGIVQAGYEGNPETIEKADSHVGGWLTSLDELKVLLKAGNHEGAANYFSQVYTPLQNEFFSDIDEVISETDKVSLEIYEAAKTSKDMSKLIIFILLIAASATTIFACIGTIKTIMKPLYEVEKAAREISLGNLSCEISYDKENEFGKLASSMRATITTLALYINNIDEVLNNIANGDLCDTVQIEYVGDFASIKKSLVKILSSLNDTISQIDSSSDSVAEGATLVSESAQALSQGTSEQASSVEELFSNITEISEQIKNNAQTSIDTNKLVISVGEELNHGNEQMSQMLSAMQDINTASDQIAKIIKTIEDIAFQTNILALNAAVEDARAGAAGKGFAVVADEVRNLAGKSAEAAKSTTELIQNSIKAVDSGTKIANGTAKSLLDVVAGASKITVMVGQISSASEQQASSAEMVTVALNQISSVVTTNSASAEESAAASEELSTHAQLLKGFVKRFKLNKNLRNTNTQAYESYTANTQFSSDITSNKY